MSSCEKTFARMAVEKIGNFCRYVGFSFDCLAQQRTVKKFAHKRVVIDYHYYYYLRNRAAQIDGFTRALSSLHKLMDWPWPSEF